MAVTLSLLNRFSKSFHRQTHQTMYRQGIIKILPRIEPVTIRYDTIYLHALKSWQNGQLSLAHGRETKKLRKTKNENRLAQEKRCRQKFLKAVRPGGRSGTMGDRITLRGYCYTTLWNTNIRKQTTVWNRCCDVNHNSQGSVAIHLRQDGIFNNHCCIWWEKLNWWTFGKVMGKKVDYLAHFLRAPVHHPDESWTIRQTSWVWQETAIVNCCCIDFD